MRQWELVKAVKVKKAKKATKAMTAMKAKKTNKAKKAMKAMKAKKANLHAPASGESHEGNAGHASPCGSTQYCVDYESPDEYGVGEYAHHISHMDWAENVIMTIGLCPNSRPTGIKHSPCLR